MSSKKKSQQPETNSGRNYSVSRFTDNGQKDTTSVSGYLYRNKEERNCLAASSSSSISIISSKSSSSEGWKISQTTYTLGHHICIPHRLPVACPPPLRERGHGERLPSACVLLLLPPPSVLILLSPSLTSSITTNGRK